MAFSQRRGRPPVPKSDGPDLGTPELCFKRAHGFTLEPIDHLLEQGLIQANHHWCGLHLRWLYTVRYGAPVITTRYESDSQPSTAPQADLEWQSMREREYMLAVGLLKQANRFEPVMRLSVFNEQPAFVNPTLQKRAWSEPALANQLNRQHQLLLEGLTLLSSHWRSKPSRSK